MRPDIPEIPTILRRPALITAIVLAALFALVACGEQDPVADPRLNPGAEPEGRILFVKDRDVHMWDGSIEQITQFGDVESPAWSRDGRRYAFVRRGDAFSDLYVGNVSNGDITALTEHEPPFEPGTPQYLNQVIWALDPEWSPAEDALVYVSDRGTNKNLLWYKPSVSEGAVPVSASQEFGDNTEKPDFSPDGNKVVYAQRTSDEENLHRWMEIRIGDLITGENESIVTEDDTNAQSAFYPRWSPDGDWIVYVQQNGEETDLWAVSIDGRTHVRLTDKGNVTAPEWSPNGDFIAFLETHNGGFKASYIEIDTSGGELEPGDPRELFTSSGIDAPSGLSWTD